MKCHITVIKKHLFIKNIYYIIAVRVNFDLSLAFHSNGLEVVSMRAISHCDCDSQKHFYVFAYSQATMSNEDAVGDTAVPLDPPAFKTPLDEHAPVAADKTDKPSSSPSLSLDVPEHELNNEVAEACAPVSQATVPPKDQSEDQSCDQVTECSETVSLDPEATEGDVEVGCMAVCNYDIALKRM